MSKPIMQQYPFIFSDEPKYRIRRHLAFWVSWWLFQGFLYSFIAINSAKAFMVRLPASMIESFIFIWVHMFLSYSLMYFVIPRFLLKQRYVLTAIWVVIFFIAAAAMSSLLALTVIQWVRQVVMGLHFIGPERRPSVRVFLALMAGLRGAITIGGIAAAIKLMKSLYMKEQRNMQLQKENIEAQLQILKAQVHPHFLFNTLNNIYAHTQNTAPVASKMVAGLSDLLRFMLYDCNQPLVPLHKEIQMLEDYIELEKIRYGNKLDIHLDLPYETKGMHIAPLLLLPFVENCFKHGTSHMLEQPWMNLQVRLEGTRMYLKLMNGKNAEAPKNDNAHGIGIENVRKRLDLLYPGKHELQITNDEDVFIVNLKLQLEQKKQPLPVKPASSLYTHA